MPQYKRRGSGSSLRRRNQDIPRTLIAGGVKAALDPSSIGKKYLTTAGDWVVDRGLFLYDYAAKMKKRYVVKVEFFKVRREDS